MKALIQRVSSASVSVDNQIISSIHSGLLVFLGIHSEDSQKEIHWIADKILGLRLFTDADDKMNLSIQDIDGELLIVSQFTLYADCQKGRRPSFVNAAPPDQAKALYLDFLSTIQGKHPHVYAGEFGAKMNVSLINDGPVTLLLEK